MFKFDPFLFVYFGSILNVASEIYWPLQNKNKSGVEDQKKGANLQWIYFGHETEGWESKKL